MVPTLETHVGVSRTLLGPEVAGLWGAVLSGGEGKELRPMLGRRQGRANMSSPGYRRSDI